MKTLVTKNFKRKSYRMGVRKIFFAPLFIFSLLILSTNVTFAHCDTMDGPLVKDAKIALEKNNMNSLVSG